MPLRQLGLIWREYQADMCKGWTPPLERIVDQHLAQKQLDLGFKNRSMPLNANEITA